MSKCEHRAIIRFLNAEGISGNEIHKRLCDVYGGRNYDEPSKRVQMDSLFNEGRTTLHDEQRSGRPADAVNDETVAIVSALLEDNRW